jgi:PST family polysaccharide transporter
LSVTVIQPQGAPEPGEDTATADQHSYGQILKSSALIGFSTVTNLAIGIIRTKAMAIWLGPAGFGLIGLYSSITDLAQSIAGMGINASGVRQIAEAVGADEPERIAQTTVVLRRTAVLLGVLGAIVVIVFSGQIATLTFGDDQHAAAIKLLSLTVFFSCLSGGQTALIQGMRRISDLVKMGVLGAAAGMVVSIPLVYFLREDGIVPALICGAAVSLIASWWYSRKIKIRTPSMTVVEIGREAAALLKLGFAFMASGLMMTGASYAIRVFVVRKLGFEAAGLYQSAWALGGMYVGVILGAMGTDFYPRLTAAARDNSACNRLVNEQTQVSILLAGPGVTATLTLAPIVITLFYSSKFQEAVEVLRWLCLGMALRVISWPMGFIIVAKGAQNLFFWSELAWTAVYVALAWMGVNAFGLNGAGIAFFGSYIFHVLMIYVLVRRLSGFHWSSANITVGLIFISTLGLVFVAFDELAYPLAMAVGIGALAAISIYSVRSLLNLASLNRIPQPVMRVLERYWVVKAAI